jgi:hypothetical protein
MPVKIWESDKKGLSSRIVTGWDTVLTAEEYRADAENLDRTLDIVLDNAVARVKEKSPPGVPAVFIRAWAVGRELKKSKVFNSLALKNEEEKLLWRGLASKCRTGARSTGEIEREWLDLRPSSAGEPRREGSKLDYFAMCIWLAEQDLQDAVDTFGGSIRNVWQVLERPTLRPISLRRALKKFFGSQSESLRKRLFEPKIYAEMMKELRRHWPDRGPGSAKRPVHYEEGALFAEVDKMLTPMVLRLVETRVGVTPTNMAAVGKKTSASNKK